MFKLERNIVTFIKIWISKHFHILLPFYDTLLLVWKPWELIVAYWYLKKPTSNTMVLAITGSVHQQYIAKYWIDDLWLLSAKQKQTEMYWNYLVFALNNSLSCWKTLAHSANNWVRILFAFIESRDK